ncbi:MAG: hypothetical protein ACK4MM_02605 [Fervidobacterium sp.]
MKKVLVILTASVVLVGSMFAFGPYGASQRNLAPAYQQVQSQTAQTAQTTQTLQTSWTRLYRNLPANATLGEVKKFKGTIKEVGWSMEDGFELKVQVDKDVYEVHAGPIFRSLELKVGQEIEIAGRLVTAGNDKYIVAEEVTTNGKTVKVTEVINAQRRAMQSARINLYKSMRRMPNVRNKQAGPRI